MMRLGRCVIQRHEWMVVACVLLSGPPARVRRSGGRLRHRNDAGAKAHRRRKKHEPTPPGRLAVLCGFRAQRVEWTRPARTWRLEGGPGFCSGHQTPPSALIGAGLSRFNKVPLGALGGAAARAHWHVAQSTLPGDVSLPIEPYAATATRAARLKRIHQPDGLHLLSNGNLLLLIYPPSRRPQVDL